MTQTTAIRLSWLALLLYVCYWLGRLTFFDDLSSIANDSVNYIVMARYYSPWQEPGEAVRSVWPLQDFPPLFPLLLAVTNTAHSLLAAHVLVVMLGLASLVWIYLYGVQVLHSRVATMLAIAMFVLSPGFLLGMQGILSESLYILLGFLFLSSCSVKIQPQYGAVFLCGILLGMAMLTRTIGFALCLAVMIYIATEAITRKRLPKGHVMIVPVGVVVYLLISWLAGPERESHYIGVIQSLFSGPGQEGTRYTAFSGILSIMEAWHTSWYIYWISEASARYIIFTLVLLLSLFSLVRRIRQNHIDAWYLLVYLSVLAIWPHPGQMMRLMLPVLPIMVIYSFDAFLFLSSRLPYKWNHKLIPAGAFTALLLVIMPAHAFIGGRLELAESGGLVPVYELFRKPDIHEATRDLHVQNRMLGDYRQIASQVPAGSSLYYAVPDYPVLLGNHVTMPIAHPLDPGQIDVMKNAGDAFLLMTELHPRKTRKGVSGFAGEEYLRGTAETTWCSQAVPYAGRVACIYRIGR